MKIVNKDNINEFQRKQKILNSVNYILNNVILTTLVILLGILILAIIIAPTLYILDYTKGSLIGFILVAIYWGILFTILFSICEIIDKEGK